MNAILRFALHVLLPPLGCGFLFVGVALISSVGRIPPGDIIQVIFLGLFFAYVVAVVPSVIYAALMEFAARRGIKPGSRRAVWLSAWLGGIIGALILLFPGGWRDGPAMLFISALGFVVGLAVEWLIGQIALEVQLQKSFCDQDK